MISISGIKYQNELERLPYFNKQEASILIGKKGKNLDKKIEQLSKKGYLIRLKNGMYVTVVYCERQGYSALYLEYLANILRFPSYLSLEYVLSNKNIIPESAYAFTSVTLKSTRSYKNKLGSFIYRNIKQDLFTGFTQKRFGEQRISIATPAKALFDFLYLKRNIGVDLEYELTEGLRINWGVFREKEIHEFAKYVKLADSRKMEDMIEVIRSW